MIGLYIKMTNYHHFQSVPKTHQFSSLKSEGLVCYSVFVGRLGQVWLAGSSVWSFFFACFYFRGYCTNLHIPKLWFTPIKEMIGALKKYNKPTQLSRQKGGSAAWRISPIWFVEE